MNHSLVNPVFLIIFILICNLSCTDKREDRSLSIDAYREMGMPDPDRKWDMEDYTQARHVLAKIKWEHPLALPVRDSEKSGSLFAHMVSLEYLSFLQDSTLSLSAKAERISAFTRVYDYWMDTYTNPTLDENCYNREIVDIQLFDLEVKESMLDLAHKINRSDDPADIQLQYGYGYIKENYLTSVNNNLKTQSHASEFFDQDLDRMADSIFTSVMRNREWMDKGEVNRMKRALRMVMDSTSSEYIRNKYERLEKSLPI